eukprot:3006129-Prorocentrum_lima.AAC.1
MRKQSASKRHEPPVRSPLDADRDPVTAHLAQSAMVRARADGLKSASVMLCGDQMVQPTHEVIGMIETLFPHGPEEVDTWEQTLAAVKSIPVRRKYICKEAH